MNGLSAHPDEGADAVGQPGSKVAHDKGSHQPKENPHHHISRQGAQRGLAGPANGQVLDDKQGHRQH